MKPGFFDALLVQLAALLQDFHLVRGVPSPTSVAVALAVGYLAAVTGLVLASRIFAPVGAPALAGLALGAAAIALGLDAIRFQLEPLGTGLHAGIALLDLGLTAALAQRVLDTSMAKALGTLLVGALFGALIATLLSRMVQLSDAI